MAYSKAYKGAFKALQLTGVLVTVDQHATYMWENTFETTVRRIA